MKYRKLFLIYFFTLSIALLSSCASVPDSELSSVDADKTARSLYAEAKSALEAGDYETAIQRLESLEARFPFGRYAQQAQLDIAYAYYKYDEPDSAVSAANRFIKLYPRHPKVDYAFYLKGVIKFNQGRSVFDSLDAQSAAKRDSGAARKAFQYFSDLIERFPESKYSEDAIERMVYLRNSLASNEIFAAKFNMKRGAYIAAVNRAKYVIQYFQRSPSVPDALEIMVLGYHKLRLHDLAHDALRILEFNFPAHKSLAKLKDLDSPTG